MKNGLSYWLFRGTSAGKWYLAARTPKSVRSPRLQAFIKEVYQDDRHYHAFDLIRSVRAFWKRQTGNVRLQSLGAPSKTTSKKERTVRSLVATNAIADPEGRLLFRLAIWLEAEHILEFGTNAGISTLYLHAANTKARLDTVEGNPAVAALAQETFKKAGIGPGLHPHVGLFDDWLKLYPTGWVEDARTKVRSGDSGRKPAATRPALDLFFLDGDHRKAPTLQYVKALLPRVSKQTVFVIADIHWSPGMEEAWSVLKVIPEVTATLDLYHFGLLFFDPDLENEHLSLVPKYWKPWQLS